MAIKLSRRDTLRAGAALFATSLVSSTVSAESNSDLSITVAVPKTASALEPVLRNDTATVQTVFSVYDRLISVDPATGDFSPAIAESWQQIDSLTWEFKIRQGAKFHDGSEVTVEDVLFSYSDARLLGPGGEGATVAKQYFRTVASVEAPDERTIRVTTEQLDNDLLYKLGGWAAEIVSKRAFEAAGGWDNWAKHPVGAGPYKIVSHDQDIELVLERHEEYWGTPAAFQRITFRAVPEAAVRVAGLAAGDFDIATLLNPDQLEGVDANPDTEIVGGPIQNIRFLSFATAKGLLADVKLRRAITHAIDRQAIVDSIWNKRTTVPNGFQDPSYASFVPDFENPVYDPNLAMKLVADSDYAGEEIIFRSQTSAYPLEIQTNEVLVEMLRAVGINVRLEIKENWSQIYAEPLESVMWTSSTTLMWPSPLGGLARNFGPLGTYQHDPFNWNAGEFNQVIAEYEDATTAEARQDAHREMLRVWQEENPPAAVLFYAALFYGKRKGIPWSPQPTLSADFGPTNASTLN